MYIGGLTAKLDIADVQQSRQDLEQVPHLCIAEGQHLHGRTNGVEIFLIFPSFTDDASSLNTMLQVTTRVDHREDGSRQK